MVSVLEDHPEFLIKKRSITLEEFILLELLFQVDYLDYKLKKWKPLSETISFPQQHILETIHKENFHFELLRLWQEAFEWSYYEKVLHYISVNAITYKTKNTDVRPDFQTIHCIDDREESFRRYLEMIHPECETFSAAGFFNIDAYYQPEHSDYRMKIAPAPAQPNHVITEKSRIKDENKDIHIESRKKSHLTGLVISQTLGIQAGWRLAMHIFRPQKNPLTIDSAEHTHPSSELILEENNTEQNCELKKGFSLQDAYIRAENFLKTTGLTRHFASVVYIIAHGAGSTNNPYYAAYDCGACSGKAGSVNARAMSYFLNKKEIREKLKQNRISIPDDTVFIPCLHNSTTDDILFYDTEKLEENKKNHLKKHREIFQKALDLNSVERARRFGTLEMKNKSVSEIHQEVRKRQYALFEVRPEYNHATNAVCVVGRRTLTRGLFLDRRCFLQSYDYKSDRDGTILANILKAVTPVCGGINLEYYYSRVDCEKLGAGSKLPHNIFGLLSVANGAEGDLRIGLPMQMTEIHDPLRLLMIVEHFPEIVLKSVAKFDEVYEWYKNEWIHLMVIHPENENLYYFRDSNFHPYSLSETQTPKKKSLDDLLKLFPKTAENIDPFILQ
jgi:uncharacterized protein YbcC (UPF0753/DUF2309 family)